MGKLRIGIVGCGTIFHYHYAFIQNYGKATLCAVADKDKKAVAAEGIKICVEQIKRFQDMEGVAGVHIMAIEWEKRVPEIVELAGLLPRPKVA